MKLLTQSQKTKAFIDRHGICHSIFKPITLNWKGTSMYRYKYILGLFFLLFVIQNHVFAENNFDTVLRQFFMTIKSNKPEDLYKIVFNHKNTERYLEQIKKHCGEEAYEANKIVYRGLSPKAYDDSQKMSALKDFDSIREQFTDEEWKNVNFLDSKQIRKTNECGTVHYSVSMKMGDGNKTVSVVLSVVEMNSDWMVLLFVHDVMGRY